MPQQQILAHARALSEAGGPVATGGHPARQHDLRREPREGCRLVEHVDLRLSGDSAGAVVYRDHARSASESSCELVCQHAVAGADLEDSGLCDGAFAAIKRQREVADKSVHQLASQELVEGRVRKCTPQRAFGDNAARD